MCAISILAFYGLHSCSLVYLYSLELNPPEKLTHDKDYHLPVALKILGYGLCISLISFLVFGFKKEIFRPFKLEGNFHKVDRVLGFFSSRQNWDPPTPHPQASVSPRPFGSGGTHSHAGDGVGGGGGPNSNEGTDTVLL
jgi:hypothetical protein